MSAALAVVLLAEQHIVSHNPANLTANGRDAAKEWEEDLVSEELVTSLERLLEEKEVSYVKVPGAIALYAIHRHSNKVRATPTWICPYNVVVLAGGEYTDESHRGRE